MAKRSPYPLQWPKTYSRTKAENRQRSKFGALNSGQLSPYEAAKGVMREIDLLGAANAVITSQLPTRHDGLPYSDGRSDDPGIAVWFVLDGHERVFACDAWHTHGENLRAIALSIEAMRGLERWGMADVVDRAFSGFTALPPGEAPKKTWREILGETWPELDNDELLVLAKSRHRKLIQAHHPDRGGDPALAAELNAAMAEAEAELGASA